MKKGISMHIYVKGIEDERLVRPLSLIADLFFEESVLSTDKAEQADLIIAIEKQSSSSAKITLAAVLEAKTSGKVYEA